MEQKKVNVNVEYNKELLNSYQDKLNEHLQKLIRKCLEAHRYKVASGDIDSQQLEAIRKKLMKKRKKLMSAIWTSSPKQDFKGNTAIYKRTFAEIMPITTTSEDFVNAIKTQHPELESDGQFEVNDYGK